MHRAPWARMVVLILAGLCLGMTGIQLWWMRLAKSGGGSLVLPGYPRLVYVPDSTSGPRLYAASAVLLEATTGTILYAHNEHVRRAPASTTKIMTALVALERGNLRSLVTVGQRASYTPGSTVGLRAQDRLSLGELLQGLMLCSGNDASVAIAEHIAGTENAFVELMNLKAREFGAFNSSFRNPHGLPATGHVTTAFDLALVTRYALQRPAFARLVRTREEEIEWAEGERRAAIANTNRLLWSFAGADGVKTGTTSEAGHCLVASATRDGRQLIAVVLRSGDRWRDAAALLDYGFTSFRLLVLAEEGKTVASSKVRQGARDEVALVPRSRLAVVCRAGQEGMVGVTATLPSQPLRAPVRPGQILGRLTVSYAGEEVDGVDLLTEEGVARRSWWQRWWRRESR